MTLNQIAQQAMDYLDSVGVAADYDIFHNEFTNCNYVYIATDEHEFTLLDSSGKLRETKLFKSIEYLYPQKSPA